jgi:quercetin dioxygenase-like cupin family protein
VTARRIDVTEDGQARLVRLAWSGAAPPSQASVSDRLRAEGVEPHQWSNGPGERYGAHRHDYEKVLMCAAGSITFLVGPAGEPVELRAGEGFVLPAGTPHAAVVGPAGCVCVEGSRSLR